MGFEFAPQRFEANLEICGLLLYMAPVALGLVFSAAMGLMGSAPRRSAWAQQRLRPGSASAPSYLQLFGELGMAGEPGTVTTDR